MPLRMCTPLRDPPQPINEKPHRHALGQWTTRWRLKGELWKKTVQMRVVLMTRTIPQTLIKPIWSFISFKLYLLLPHYVTEYFPCIVDFSATTFIFTCTQYMFCEHTKNCMQVKFFMHVYVCTSMYKWIIQFSSKVLWYKNQAIYFIHSRNNWIC